MKSKSSLKQTWKILNEAINRKGKLSKLPSVFKINDQEISDPSVIADKFCSYFSNIGPNLADKIPQSSISHLSSWLLWLSKRSFYFFGFG